MPVTHKFRQGSTDPIDMQLLTLDPETEVASAADITGWQSVVCRLRSKDQSQTVTFTTEGGSPDLTVTDAATGKVRLLVEADDFDDAEQWYEGYFRVIDAAGNTVDFPQDGTFEVEIAEYF